MKLSDNGKNTVTVDFGNGVNELHINVDKYPAEVQQYGKLRGFRKFYSDQGAGFEGTPAQLREKCVKAHERLTAGEFRSSGDRGVTEAELADMFRKLAPEATEEAIATRVVQMHPDNTKDEKEKVKRQRKVREIANTVKMLQGLEPDQDE